MEERDEHTGSCVTGRIDIFFIWRPNDRDATRSFMVITESSCRGYQNLSYYYYDDDDDDEIVMVETETDQDI